MPDPSRSAQRRGFAAAELLLVLPVFLVLLVGMIEFSAVLVARQRLLAASAEGARVAALGGDQLEVEAAVNRILGTGWTSAATLATESENDATSEGEADDWGAIPAGEPITVRLHVPARTVAPDLLRFVGLGLRDHELTATTTMMKE